MSTIELSPIRQIVQDSIENLLRTADSKVNWTNQSYSFIPGVYTWTGPVPTTSPDVPTATYKLILHQDNVFEYFWQQKKAGSRPSEYYVEMQGTWSKPVLNRDFYGNYTSTLTLDGTRIRFQRFSHFENDKWKLQLKTFERQPGGWVHFGDGGLPACTMQLTIDQDSLQRTDTLTPQDILSTSTASRVLAGLTKKAVARLGTPIGVMTDRWLIPIDHPLTKNHETREAREFNPLKSLAALIKERGSKNCPKVDLPEEIRPAAFD